jgi:hypothetical protein
MIIHECEQRSPEWHALRLGIPTASEFSQLVTPTGKPSASLKTYAMSLAAELFIGRPVNMWAGNAWTERGREMEDQAVSLYEFAHDVETRRIGFVTNDDNTAGCSPDAFVGDDGMLEIKCLKAEHHIAAIMHFKRTGMCPPDYVPQTQGQLMLCERAWCDLVFYSPELPLLPIRQTPRPAIMELLGKQITALIAERDEVLSTLRSLSPAE